MKNRSLLLALLALIPIGLSACGQGEEDPISISIRDNRQYFIPGTTTSCKNRRDPDAPRDDVASSYFKFQDVTFTWADTKSNAYISYIQVEYTIGSSSTSLKKCKIGGDELLAMSNDWWSFGRPVVGGPDIPKDDGSGTSYTPKMSIKVAGCGMICGGISAGDIPFISYGTVKVVGYKITETGETVPISTTTAITLENK